MKKDEPLVCCFIWDVTFRDEKHLEIFYELFMKFIAPLCLPTNLNKPNDIPYSVYRMPFFEWLAGHDGDLRKQIDDAVAQEERVREYWGGLWQQLKEREEWGPIGKWIEGERDRYDELCISQGECVYGDP